MTSHADVMKLVGLVVTQADIDAAKAHAAEIGWYGPRPGKVWEDEPLTIAFARHRTAALTAQAAQIEALKGDAAPMWRSGVGFGATVLDQVRRQFAGRKKHSPALRDFDKALDDAIQRAVDLSRSEGPTTYRDSQDAEARIRAQLSKVADKEG